MFGLTGFDLIVLVLVAISTVNGFRKGFTSEILRLIAWAGAIFLTVVALPGVAPVIQNHIPVEWVANILAVVITFLLSYMALGFLSRFIGGRIRASFIAPLDRALGIAFGAARGALIVCGTYVVVTMFVPEKAHPDWVTEGRLYDPVRIGASVITDITPDLFEDAKDIVEDGGYEEQAREEMNDLIEDVASGDEDEEG